LEFWAASARFNSSTPGSRVPHLRSLIKTILHDTFSGTISGTPSLAACFSSVLASVR
jgi:hypothetical protein